MTSIRIHGENECGTPGGEISQDEPDDDLDAEEGAELHAALDEAEADFAAGRVATEDEVWAMLRAIE
jgi:hypothetical protein